MGMAIAIAVALLLFSILGILLPPPQFLNPEELPMGWAHVRHYGLKAATLEAAYRKGILDSDTPVGFILGQSNVREAFDPEIVSRSGDQGIRWVVFSGSGGSLKKMKYLSEPLFLSRIKPAVAVLGISPHMLLGQPNPAHIRPPNTDISIMNLFNGSQKSGWNRLLDREWIFTKRREVNNALKHYIYRIRLRLFDWFGLGPDDLFSPHPRINPFGADPKAYRTPRAPIRDLKRQISFLKLVGKFGPQNYQTNGEQAQALIRLISKFRKLDAQVIVVLMPEAKHLRSRMPSEALQTLLTDLKNAFPINTIPVIDMRDVMPDEYFYDYGHLNWAGRKRFSYRFAETIAPYLKGRKLDNDDQFTEVAFSF